MKPHERIAAIGLVLIVLIQAERGRAPKVSGPVHTILCHEASTDDHAFAQLTLALRTGSPAEYFASAGRRLSILDQHGKDERGQQVATIEPADLAGVTLPAILCYRKSGKLAGKESLPASATAQTVIEIARRYGG